MTRRPLIALAVAATAVLSGCATFTDNDVAARVDTTELSESQLASLLQESAAAAGQPDDVDRVSGGNIAGLLNNFVLHEVLGAQLAAAGVDVSPLGDDLTLESLNEATTNVINTWQEAPAIRPTDDEIEAWYNSGPLAANLVCSAHILVETEDEANAAIARLDAGEAFGDVAADVSTDTVSAINGGALPCSDVQTFAGDFIPEFVEAALDAEIDVPVGPIESQFGYHVIRLRPLDDVSAAELDDLLQQPSVRFGFAARGADVYINPRYGAFDPASGVVPLG